ncbi:MAG: O-antigen ligase family protein [Planctomycetota bacterium]
MSSGAIAVLSLCVLVCAAAILLPWVGFVGYATCAMLAPQWVWREYLADSELQKFISAMTVVGFVLTGCRSQTLPRGVKWAMGFYSLYVFLVVIGAQLHSNPINAQKSVVFVDITWKIWMMCMIGIMLINTERKLAICMLCMVLVTSWNAWELNLKYLRQGAIRVHDFYFAGLDNNLYSISTLPVIGITLAYFFSAKLPFRQFLVVILLAMQVHQIMILESRGTMLGVLLCGALATYFMPKNPRTIAAVIAVGIVGAILAGPPVIREFSSIFSSGEQRDNSASSRFKVWGAGAAIMLDNPVTGVGPWAGEAYVPKYIVDYKERRNYKALHNLFFEIGTGMGVPGVASYLMFFAIPWFMHYQLWRRHRQELSEVMMVCNLAALAGIPGYWMASMFSSGALIESPYLLVACACASLAVSHTQLQKNAQDKLAMEEVDEMEVEEDGDLESESYSDRSEQVAVAR